MLKKDVLHSLMNLLPKGHVLTDRTTLVAYEVDAGIDKGLPEGVVFPRSTEEVMLITHWASEHGVPLVARGAGTGLSGGAVADCGGLIVEFVHMHRILDIDVLGRSALVEPAMINLRLDERAKESGLYFPPDPASQRASTIGGNVAENSGGPHCFKYGVTTNYVTGMEIVLADGRRVQLGGRTLDYPEYDLCGLLTGSEGMLGLITSISLRLLRNPPAVKTLLVAFDSLALAGDAVSAVISAGLVPATMEMMDQRIIHIVEPFAHANLPLDAGAVLIIEFDGYPESLDVQADEVIRILKRHGGRDMRVARDEEERSKIWLARKSAGGAIAYDAPAYYSMDVTVPRSRLTEMLTQVSKVCTAYDLRFGQMFHAGDGNLHPLLLIPEPDNPDLLARVYAAAQAIVQSCVDMGGSMTGEHGVGIEKREFMSLMHKSSELLAMWDVKQAFDPQELLNPGKVFPRPAENESGSFAGYAQSSLPSSQILSANTPIEKIFTPTSVEDAAQYLQALSRVAQPVTITGALPREVSAKLSQISTSALRGIKEYAPDDLYITVGSGTPLLEIQAFLAQHNKQLALSSPWSEATIGGLVAANVNAPQRMRYGAVRDNVLCATVALADGRVIRTGRPLVKNVAGFDLTKAFVGSYGTLGLLTDLSLKIMVQPRMRRTLLVPVHNLTDGLRWGQRMLTLALTASSILLSKGYMVDVTHPPQATYLLSYTAEGIPEDVRAELAEVRIALKQDGMSEPLEVENISGMGGTSGTTIWRGMLGQAGSTVVRAGVPVRELPAYMLSQPKLWQEERSAWVADFGSGCVYAIKPEAVALDSWLAVLRQPALERTGYALVMSASADVSIPFNRWGYQPESLAIMQRLKARWDPQGILSPNTFVVDEVS